MADITIHISDKILRIATIAIFATIAICMFVFLRSSGIFVPTYRLSIYAPEAEGLTAGSPVMLDGIQVGTVYAVSLAEGSANAQRKVEVALRLEKRYQDMIRTDSKASFMTQGFLGNRAVTIQRGYSGVPIKAREEIPFVPERQMTGVDIVDLLKKIADCQKQETQPPKPVSR
jgi:ABC-type transporter Mla subunit MlaD